MYTIRRRAQYTEVYKDRDLIFYLSYYHCLQTVRKSFDKQKLKGHTTVLYLIDFKKVVTMTSLALELSFKIKYTVSESQMIH